MKSITVEKCVHYGKYLEVGYLLHSPDVQQNLAHRNTWRRSMNASLQSRLPCSLFTVYSGDRERGMSETIPFVIGEYDTKEVRSHSLILCIVATLTKYLLLTFPLWLKRWRCVRYPTTLKKKTWNSSTTVYTLHPSEFPEPLETDKARKLPFTKSAICW